MASISHLIAVTRNKTLAGNVAGAIINHRNAKFEERTTGFSPNYKIEMASF